jgi:hypothetical protein
MMNENLLGRLHASISCEPRKMSSPNSCVRNLSFNGLTAKNARYDWDFPSPQQIVCRSAIGGGKPLKETDAPLLSFRHVRRCNHAGVCWTDRASARDWLRLPMPACCGAGLAL